MKLVAFECPDKFWFNLVFQRGNALSKSFTFLINKAFISELTQGINCKSCSAYANFLGLDLKSATYLVSKFLAQLAAANVVASIHERKGKTLHSHFRMTHISPCIASFATSFHVSPSRRRTNLGTTLLSSQVLPC